jgi:hypothetical protein
MYRTFSGTITGHGLDAVQVMIEAEPEYFYRVLRLTGRKSLAYNSYRQSEAVERSGRGETVPRPLGRAAG